MEEKLFMSKNKEYVKDYNKKRYLENREKLLVDSKIKSQCLICNCEIVRNKMSRHLSTKKHISKIK